MSVRRQVCETKEDPIPDTGENQTKTNKVTSCSGTLQAVYHAAYEPSTSVSTPTTRKGLPKERDKLENKKVISVNKKSVSCTIL